jgi:membrane-bound lytic murein transglycosylase D
MARMLALNFILALFFTSCGSITPLTRKPIPSDSQVASKASGKSLENTADLKELDELSLESDSSDTSTKTVVEVKELDDKDLAQAEEEIIKTYAKEELKKEDPVNTVAEGEADFSLDYKKKHYDFWYKYFSKRESKRFKRHVRNGLKFKKVVDRIFEEEGLPKDLFFVGLIESGYNTHIKSRASAVGPWQFIKGTAKRYNMRVDKQLDERRNIFKATRAAANYFKDLYNIFGSWELALCAYNAGEYRIINAIRRGNTRDYKELVSKKLLPRETIFYIPKVAAAKALYAKVAPKLTASGNPEIYDTAEELKVYKGISLKKLARSLKVSRKTLKTLNPDIRWDYVSKRRKGHRLYVPQSIAKVAKQKIKSLPKGRTYRRTASASHVHRVKRGESLYKIARKYNTTIRKIKRDNRLRRNRIFIGQKLKVRSATKATTYRVRKGDNLSTIAAKFGLSTRDLKAINGISGSRIYVGQKLRLSGNSKRVYVVRRGDNLYRIARKFGVSVRKIVQANSLKGKTIFPKQKIILPI